MLGPVVVRTLRVRRRRRGLPAPLEDLAVDVVLALAGDGPVEGGDQWVLVPEVPVVGELVGEGLVVGEKSERRGEGVSLGREGDVGVGGRGIVGQDEDVVGHEPRGLDELAAAGVPGDLVRLSCGLESKEDLIADIAQALDKA